MREELLRHGVSCPCIPQHRADEIHRMLDEGGCANEACVLRRLGCFLRRWSPQRLDAWCGLFSPGGVFLLRRVSICRVRALQKKDTSMTFWAERIFFCHTYDTSMTITVTKPGIIIDVVGSYFYDKKS